MKKRSMVLVLTLVLVLTNIPSAWAAFEWPIPEWNIPFVGTMKTPDGFSAVDVKDFRLFIDQEKKDLLKPKKPTPAKAKPSKGETPFPDLPADLPPILTETVPTDPDALTKRFLKSDFALYHLTNNVLFADDRPGFWCVLLHTKGNLALFCVHGENLDFDLLSDLQRFLWMLQLAPGNLRNVQQAVDSADVYESSVISEPHYGSFYYIAHLE